MLSFRPGWVRCVAGLGLREGPWGLCEDADDDDGGCEDGDWGTALPLEEEEPFDGTLPIAQLGKGTNGGNSMPESLLYYLRTLRVRGVAIYKSHPCTCIQRPAGHPHPQRVFRA